MKAKWVSTFMIVMMLMVAFGPTAGCSSREPDPANESIGTDSDNGRSPLGDQQAVLMAKGLDAKLDGKAPDKVHQVAKGQYVELAREGEDKIRSVLAEFGDQIVQPQGGTPGPLHNQIPAPDRSVDNTSIWSPDLTKDYYENLLFSLGGKRCLHAEFLHRAVLQPVYGQWRGNRLGAGTV